MQIINLVHCSLFRAPLFTNKLVLRMFCKNASPVSSLNCLLLGATDVLEIMNKSVLRMFQMAGFICVA